MSNQSANTTKISRADYKAIKHMNRDKLSEYLNTIWKRGFEKGYKAAIEAAKQKTVAKDTAQPTLESAT